MYASQPRPGAPLGGASAPDPRREEQVEAAMSSRIEAGLTIEGSVRGDGELVVAGRLRGALTLHGTLVVEEGGSVEAEVEADRVVVSGLLSGSVQAHDELRILPGGFVDARVRALRLSVADGATFRGELQPPASADAALPEAPTAPRLRSGRAAPALPQRAPQVEAPPPVAPPVAPPRPRGFAPPPPRQVSPKAPPAASLPELPTRRPPPPAAPPRPVGPPRMPALPRGRVGFDRREP